MLYPQRTDFGPVFLVSMLSKDIKCLGLLHFCPSHPVLVLYLHYQSIHILLAREFQYNLNSFAVADHEFPLRVSGFNQFGGNTIMHECDLHFTRQKILRPAFGSSRASQIGVRLFRTVCSIEQ